MEFLLTLVVRFLSVFTLSRTVVKIPYLLLDAAFNVTQYTNILNINIKLKNFEGFLDLYLFTELILVNVCIHCNFHHINHCLIYPFGGVISVSVSTGALLTETIKLRKVVYNKFI